MKKTGKEIVFIIRMALTIWVLIMAYKETGPFTASALALITFTLEMVAKMIVRIIRILDSTADLLHVHRHRETRP